MGQSRNTAEYSPYLSDKKTSTTYALVHRSQNDPLIHDSDAPSQLFREIAPKKSSKVKQRGDLDEEFGLGESIRDNEGEAAEHGIYYDDSSYDYMQHMRDLGSGPEARWIEAPSKTKGKGKAKQSLEDALSAVSLDDDARSIGNESHASAWIVEAQDRSKYQAQQDIPDELAGFQPNMDPRLREVLEALEDEEYVDDDDDIFAALAGDGVQEVRREEWEDAYFDDDELGDDEGWESDTTEKPVKEYKSSNPDSMPSDAVKPLDSDVYPPSDEASVITAIPAPAIEDQDFLANFSKAKAIKPDKAGLSKPEKAVRPTDMSSASILTSSTALGRRKKRKGALTSDSGFSMTSSSLARTEPLNTLDARFEKISESYMDGASYDDEVDDSVSLASGMSGLSRVSRMSRGSAWGGSQASQAPELMPSNFDSILDDFLGGKDGDKRFRPMKKAGVQGRWQKDQGLKQLDELRHGLGPARIQGKTRIAS